MIETRTVMVLGAGASKPYGLPLGGELRELILKMNEDDLREIPTGPQTSSYDHSGAAFLHAFRRSQFASIDAFLARRPEFSVMGKHAIAKALLPRENADALLDKTPDDHWYRYLAHKMDAAWDEIPANKISFITFNYDRSLELFLQETFASAHGRPADEARLLVEKIPIVHVYGKLGSMNPELPDFVPYGGGGPDQGSRYLYHAEHGLRVIPEGRDNSPEFITARDLLESAKRICFLGFGFDRMNVERLGNELIGAGGRMTGGSGQHHLPFAACRPSPNRRSSKVPGPA